MVAHAAFGRPAPQDSVAIGDVVRAARALRGWIAAFALFGLAAAGLYIAAATPLYTARTQVLVRPRALPLTNAASTPASSDVSEIESDLALIRSERVIERAIAQADPDGDRDAPGPILPARDFVHAALVKLGLSHPPAEDAFSLRRRDIDRVSASMNARRVSLSTVLEISYDARTPENAAMMANALAAAFIAERAQARADSARQGSDWLEGRVEELRGQLSAAAAQLQRKRARRDYRITDAPQGETGEGDGRGAPEPSLEELQTNVTTLTRTYETFLQALTESTQRQTLVAADARVITAATRASPRTHPKRGLIVVFGLCAGALAGGLVGYARRSFQRRIDSRAALVHAARADCLATLPHVASVGGGALSRMTGWIAPGGRDRAAQARLRLARLAPFSRYADQLRGLQTALALLDRAKPVKTLGFISCLAGEGKSTLIANLAELWSSSGQRALIIDADLRNPTLSRTLARDPTVGLADALGGVIATDRCVRATRFEGVDILPAVGAAPADSHALLGGRRMAQVLESAAQLYDHVLVDLSPVGLAPDGYAAAPLLDAVILVAECDRVPADLVEEAAGRLAATRASLVGCVLSKTPASLAPRERRYSYPAGAPVG